MFGVVIMVDVCPRCEVKKTNITFSKDKSRSDGFSYLCKKCSSLHSKNYRLTNAKHITNLNRIRRNEKYSSEKARHAIGAHKKKGHICEITIQELTQLFTEAIHCPICGVLFTKKFGTGLLQSSPSMDRKDNENVITKDNIWIICTHCNATKRDRTMKEFVKYCDNVSTKFKEMI